MKPVFPFNDRVVLCVLINYLREKGCQKIAVASEDRDSIIHPPQFYLNEGLNIHIVTHPHAISIDSTQRDFPQQGEEGQQIVSPKCALDLGVDGIILLDKDGLPNMMRQLELPMQRGVAIIPHNPTWLLPWEDIYNLEVSECVKRSQTAEYLAVSNLSGHFVEFGTFWGRIFLSHYFLLRDIIDGKFWSFDSYAGLSVPSQDEIDFTGGDFNTGHYCCNRRSFDMYMELLGIEQERVEVIEGFYDQTLAGNNGATYGLEPESVSACIIDCDLKQPSRQVLEFMLPLLQPGALIYFDDWRLTRGSPDAGQRSAALEWLTEHPEVELVELYQTSWRNQAFIFHRRSSSLTGVHQKLSI